MAVSRQKESLAKVLMQEGGNVKNRGASAF